MIKIQNIGNNGYMLFNPTKIIETETEKERFKIIIDKVEISNLSLVVVVLSPKQMKRFDNGFRFTQNVIYKNKVYGIENVKSNVFILTRRNIIKSAYD